jgi:hypothetical protein
VTEKRWVNIRKSIIGKTDIHPEGAVAAVTKLNRGDYLIEG